MSPEKTSFQRRLVTLENVFDREMKSNYHFREDWLLWRMFSVGKWRIFVISEKICLVTLENIFDREIKSEYIHHFREDWSLWRTFSIGKWRVNVFIISERIGHSGESFRSGNEKIHHFREDWFGYSGERFRSGNEEWMYSSFQGRFVTLENVFDGEMKSECIHHFREDLSLWRTFSIGEWRVFIISRSKIGYSWENQFSIGKWRINVTHSSFPDRRRLVAQREPVFNREMKSTFTHSSFPDRRLVTLNNQFSIGI